MQPLLGKYLLPWYGGVPSVWISCLVFFQVGLLGGYAYAYFLKTKISFQSQLLLHAALLVASGVFLPLHPDESWQASGGVGSSANIFLLLAWKIGPPYLLLASTGPLLQSWLAHLRPGYAPYRLFALSNAGSLAALFLYPFALEPFLTRATQAALWSIGYGVFALLGVGCAWAAWKKGQSPFLADAPETKPAANAPGTAQRFFWIGLSAGPSLLLLAATNHLCQELPSFPFLWVLPLGLYLLSFILCFEREGIYRRPVFFIGMVLALVGACYLLRLGTNPAAWLTITGFSAVVFFCSMGCHGELSRRKPDPAHLSSFYLCIAAGGALGGAFGGIVAPELIPGYLELHLALLLCPLLVLGSYWTDPRCDLYSGRPRSIWAVIALGTAMLCFDLAYRASDFFAGALFHSRDFFGVIRIYDATGEKTPETYRILTHGAINHGYQCVDPESKRKTPAGYYGKESGAHEAFRFYLDKTSLRVGVVGLGAGTIAGYGRPGDTIRFYEISAAMEAVARDHFYYLKDSRADCTVVLGDARLSLQREPPQEFDILILDAFNSDSIPAHLLTSEAFTIYKKHLKPDGILAAHTSNKFLDLEPLVRTLGKEQGMDSVFLNCPADLGRGTMESEWGLLCAEPNKLDPLREKAARQGRPIKTLRGEPWTDEFGSLFQVLK